MHTIIRALTGRYPDEVEWLLCRQAVPHDTNECRTVGEIREICKDLPDDAVVVIGRSDGYGQWGYFDARCIGAVSIVGESDKVLVLE